MVGLARSQRRREFGALPDASALARGHASRGGVGRSSASAGTDAAKRRLLSSSASRYAAIRETPNSSITSRTAVPSRNRTNAAARSLGDNHTYRARRPRLFAIRSPITQHENTIVLRRPDESTPHHRVRYPDALRTLAHSSLGDACNPRARARQWTLSRRDADVSHRMPSQSDRAGGTVAVDSPDPLACGMDATVTLERRRSSRTSLTTGGVALSASAVAARARGTGWRWFGAPRWAQTGEYR